jgi:hypothetical protein
MISESSQDILLDLLDKLEDKITKLDSEVDQNIEFESVVDREKVDKLLFEVFRAYSEIRDYVL